MSRLSRLVFASLCLRLCVPAIAAPLVPLEDFIRDPDVSQMHLSPDGAYESLLHDSGGQPSVCCQPVGTHNATVFDLGTRSAAGEYAPRSVYKYEWVGNDRLMLWTEVWNYRYGMIAANRDGSAVEGVSGLETLPVTRGVYVNVNLDSLLWASRCIYNFNDPGHSVLLLDEHTYNSPSRLYPDVVRVSTMTHATVTVAKNPGNVVGWGVDHSGQVRIGVTMDDHLKTGAIQRSDDSAPWKPLGFPDLKIPGVWAFDADNRHLFVSALSPQNRTALYRVDLAHPTHPDLVASDPEYDVLPEGMTIRPDVDGHMLEAPVFSYSRNVLIGLKYLREGPQVHWFDPTFERYQQAVDHAMPHTFNLCVDFSWDEKRILYFCFSDRDPGTYVLLDAKNKSIQSVAKRRPWINPDAMARMFPVAYRARDGVTIHGYVTVPVGVQPKHLPLVVMPHGGPWVRDVWAFDPLVQFLANRGYAVLQMNYRGSPGYGHEFYKLGQKEIGGRIQDDIEDGTRWAIAGGLADPHRIAIVGASYGGYSALYALGHNPGLYRCGISIDGVTDWVRIFHKLDDEAYKFSRAYWIENVGDPHKDEAELKAISPVTFAAKITDPLLVIQGSQDHVVLPSQAHELVDAMKSAGRNPETLYLSDNGHGMTTFKGRRDGYQAIERFLAVHLGGPSGR
ncbi:MAG TPA: prolyl oligopeptidase family serine peptidase [Opitutaceae bacterium]|nr:prolyl oligopeptidase family serine peptidase [Opitutaceae bacterium]